MPKRSSPLSLLSPGSSRYSQYEIPAFAGMTIGGIRGDGGWGIRGDDGWGHPQGSRLGAFAGMTVGGTPGDDGWGDPRGSRLGAFAGMMVGGTRGDHGWGDPRGSRLGAPAGMTVGAPAERHKKKGRCCGPFCELAATTGRSRARRAAPDQGPGSLPRR